MHTDGTSPAGRARAPVSHVNPATRDTDGTSCLAHTVAAGRAAGLISPATGRQPLPSTLGTPQPFRDAIAEVLAGASAYIEIGQNYAFVADDAGLDHAVRCLVAHTRSAVSLLADLKEMQATQARRRAEAQAGGRP